jgi:ribosomal protein L7/L12
MAFSVIVPPSQERRPTITVAIGRVKISIPADVAMSRPTPRPQVRKSNSQFASSPPLSDATVSLIVCGDHKIEVIKEVRTITALDLKGAKDLVDNAPSILKEGVSWSEAVAIKAALEGVGATIAIQPSRRRGDGHGAPQHVGGGHGA